MTKQEAITYLEDAKSDLPYKFGQALDMAIEALSAESVQGAVPTVVRVTMSDGNQYYLEHERDECDHCVYKWGAKGGDEE